MFGKPGVEEKIKEKQKTKGEKLIKKLENIEDIQADE